MAWIERHRRIWGFTVLILLCVASMGPWGFQRIHVPAQYTCSPPFVRLIGDFCGEPFSFAWGLLVVLSGIFVRTVTSGVLFNDMQTLFQGILYIIMALLPIMSCMLWIVTGRHLYLASFHLMAWGVTTLLVWFNFAARLLTTTLSFHPAQLWGLWLYTGLASTLLILEISAFVARRRAQRVAG